MQGNMVVSFRRVEEGNLEEVNADIFMQKVKGAGSKSSVDVGVATIIFVTDGSKKLVCMSTVEGRYFICDRTGL